MDAKFVHTITQSELKRILCIDAWTTDEAWILLLQSWIKKIVILVDSSQWKLFKMNKNSKVNSQAYNIRTLGCAWYFAHQPSWEKSAINKKYYLASLDWLRIEIKNNSLICRRKNCCSPKIKWDPMSQVEENNSLKWIN